MCIDYGTEKRKGEGLKIYNTRVVIVARPFAPLPPPDMQQSHPNLLNQRFKTQDISPSPAKARLVGCYCFSISWLSASITSIVPRLPCVGLTHP